MKGSKRVGHQNAQGKKKMVSLGIQMRLSPRSIIPYPHVARVPSLYFGGCVFGVGSWRLRVSGS